MWSVLKILRSPFLYIYIYISNFIFNEYQYLSRLSRFKTVFDCYFIYCAFHSRTQRASAVKQDDNLHPILTGVNTIWSGVSSLIGEFQISRKVLYALKAHSFLKKTIFAQCLIRKLSNGISKDWWILICKPIYIIIK